MAFVVPISWRGGNGRYLEQACTQTAISIPSRTIYFEEISPEVSLRDARLSQQVGSAAVMSFAVNQDALESNINREIFTKAILGGYATTNNKKNIPYKHPYLPGLYAKDIISYTPLETQTSTAGQVTSNYNLCKVTISFESFNYPVDKTTSAGGDDYNPNWIEFKYESGSNKQSIPTGWYEYGGMGLFAGVPATFGMWKNQPYTNFSMTIYQCNRGQVFGINPLSVKPVLATFIGYVNNVLFASCFAETILFDSMAINPWTDWLGNQLYNVRLNFIYNENGWNNALDPSGTVTPIQYVIGGLGPFEATGFKTLIQSLNPF